ncbi:conjugal transfer protein TraI [Chitinophaga filiformis]|uniref:Conjugal transfer protein TraI n=1 Tax=Chitinophaga filiformis TaxID=104663 RepID=A0ABY4HW65_CHIFI|nr:conjugal transfer protein TraI [Chitinophaga filiformis]UPK68030.1 conjugal transfer protein TraI [Chitinophaga filiformis]
MNRCVWIFMVCVGLLTLVPTQQTHAVIWVVVKEALKKVIKAMDLAVQRVQNETIRLQAAQRALENAMSKLKLQEIGEWGEKQRAIFDTYYKELQRVRAAIAYYKRIKSIIRQQADLVSEYKKYYSLFERDAHFSPTELYQISKVYNGMLLQCVKNLDEILLVTNAFATQMSDAARLAIIDKAAGRIEKNIADLRHYSNQNIVLSLQRTKDKQELSTVKAMYGLR